MSFRRLVSSAALALCLASACTGGGEAQGDDSRIRVALRPDVSVDQLLADADDGQVALFRDGAIDLADYERATFALLACYEESGVAIQSWPEYDEVEKRFRYGFFVPDDPDWQTEVNLPCITKHHMYVQMTWDWQTRATEAEIQAAQLAMGACLREAGFGEGIAEAPTNADYARLLADESSAEAAGLCREAVLRDLGVAAY